MRFRFTSPHPKDFPDELLSVIRSLPNACASLHIPAQSGSTSVLSAMRRGYSRQTYLDLINRVRELLPHVSISSDFISGFCGETEEDHQQTLTLLQEVQFDKAFMFAYSMREKTHAHRRLSDDVPEDVKQRRLSEVIATFTEGARRSNDAEVGRYHLVLLEGPAKKLSPRGEVEWMGRTDTNKRVVLPYTPLRSASGGGGGGGGGRDTAGDGPAGSNGSNGAAELPRQGDYVAVRITESLSANTLRAAPLALSSIAHFADAESRNHVGCWSS